MKTKNNSKACIHWTLNKCVPNVLSLQELNDQIEPLFLEMKESKSYWKREWCGIENITWHQTCISKALKKKYGAGSYVWKKIKFDDMQDFLETHKTGRFYLHGILNYKLFSKNPAGNWTHTICVDIDSGKFYDNTSDILMEGYSILEWFINCREEQKYLSRIDRIYQLQINC